MSYKYDHRQLADEMEIFFLDEEIGAGLPVWLPHGAAIREALENFIKQLEHQHGYERVVSPHLGKESLYQKSGHLSCFGDNMFPPLVSDSQNYFLKPMNCPHHHKVFAARPRSYRQLPLRLAEYGQVYRHELSGSLRGLSRVRGLCQNDAHIYVDPSKVESEILKVLELHELCYQKIGLKGYRYRLSKGDLARPHDFQGPPKKWQQAEELLRQSLLKKGLDFFEASGEAAFYGPKIDVQMKMSSGLEESIASLQVDFLSAERFELSFIGADGSNCHPWVLHRAPLGSHERFVALLLEFFDGQLPGWLAPVQLMILPQSDQQMEFCAHLQAKLLQKNLRAHLDRNQGRLSKRVLLAHRWRPFAKMVVGPREVQQNKGVLQLREQKLEVDFAKLVEVLDKAIN